MKGRVIAIGASMDGVSALSRPVAQLPGDLPAAVLLVLHTSPNAGGFLPGILSRAGQIPAMHAHESRPARHGPGPARAGRWTTTLLSMNLQFGRRH